MKRIEPGMLCLVTAGGNAGRQCTTIRRVQENEVIPSLGNALAMEGWLVHGPSIECFFESGMVEWHSGLGCVPENDLMPISGGDKLEDLETEKDLGVTA